MRLAALVCSACVFVVMSCSNDTPAPSDDGKAETGEPKHLRSLGGALGERFRKYELPEYELVDHDVLYGLGGRWISLRYKLKDGAEAEKESIRQRIADALARNGWQPKTLPSGKYVPSELYETSSTDLYYSRGPFEGDRDHVFYNQAVYISASARVVCCYYEAGW